MDYRLTPICIVCEAHTNHVVPFYGAFNQTYFVCVECVNEDGMNEAIAIVENYEG